LDAFCRFLGLWSRFLHSCILYLGKIHGARELHVE
jgi:hypothetical protein